MFTASCLCNGVQFTIDSDITEISVCHCKQCQKAQGGGYLAISQVAKKDLHITKGEALLQSYFSSPNKKRVFCQVCASPLYSEKLDKPDVVRLRIGIINEPLNAKIVSHAYAEEKALWDIICDTAPQYAKTSPMSSQ